MALTCIYIDNIHMHVNAMTFSRRYNERRSLRAMALRVPVVAAGFVLSSRRRQFRFESNRG